MKIKNCYKFILLFLYGFLFFYSKCLAASASANYTLVNYSLNSSAAAGLSSENNKAKAAIGQNIVVLSESPLYKSLPGYISGITATALTFASDTLDNVYVYPNPYKPSSQGSIYQAQYLTFKNLPQRATIKIFSLSGELIAALEKDSSLNQCQWVPKNDAGNRLSSGLYFYYITDGQGRKSKGKFTVIR
ncbi:MAG: T9SS type A sorting domain-containing protein [Elusimicrobia bacterium]|nr:T9SS type A sorting domain-containing protein [Candidatus Liberimonas magnetica]